MDDTALIYSFIILLAVFGVLLSLLMLKYLSLVKSIKEKSSQDQQNSTNEAGAAAAKLAQADSQARSIIESAYQKAKEVAAQSSSFAQKEHSLAQEVYDKAIKAEIEQLQKDIQLSRSKSIEILNTATDVAAKEIGQLTQKTAGILEKQSSQIASDFKQELAKSIQKTESEFENYKKMRLAQFEADLTKLTAVLATQIIKKEIDKDKHKQLVTETLAQFKKDVLSNS